MWRHSLHEPPGREAPIERASSGGRYYVDETWLLSMLRRWRHACMNSWCTSWCCGRLEGKGFGHEPLGKNENTQVMAWKELGWERCQLCIWRDWVGLSMASCVDLMEQAGDGRGVHWVACCHVCWTGKATSSHAETRKGRHVCMEKAKQLGCCIACLRCRPAQGFLGWSLGLGGLLELFYWADLEGDGMDLQKDWNWTQNGPNKIIIKR